MFFFLFNRLDIGPAYHTLVSNSLSVEDNIRMTALEA